MSWAKSIRLQASLPAQEDFHRMQEAFAQKEESSKHLQKNLESLFLTSNKLRQKAEATKSILQMNVPRAEGALNQITGQQIEDR